jgi:hypothetical protein
VASAAHWRREDGDDLVLALHVHPGATRTAVAGVHGDGEGARLRLRLAAPPVDGKANAELVRYLAASFGVPQRCVSIERGEASRQKTVRIARPALRPDRDWADNGKGVTR